MLTMKLAELCRACGGSLIGDGEIEITDITTDSRTAKRGSLFAALVGERTDGHKYINTAFEKGASAALCEKQPDENGAASYILVGSTLKALQDIAAYILKKTDIPTVEIGGSVGKTSTKEAVASVLEQRYSVLKTDGNFNNDLGVPLTVFGIKEENNAAVIETGIDDFGQMELLSSIVRPYICILTNIGDCHLENLGDRSGVLRAKSEMFDNMRENGHIILNGDDAYLAPLKDVHGVKPVFFGLDKKNDIYADKIESMGLNGSTCKIHTASGSFFVKVPKPGVHMIYNALAATAAGIIMGLSLDEVKRGIEGQENVGGRFNIIDRDGIRIIDDCYNANPMSMKASLEALSSSKGRKVAILGDMGELGENEKKLHEDVGGYAAEDGINEVYCIGSLSRYMADAARVNPDCHVLHFETVQDFIGEMPRLIRKGDTVLVKASHFMKFDDIVKALTEDGPDRKDEKAHD